jgi:hypothetical protein
MRFYPNTLVALGLTSFATAGGAQTPTPRPVPAAYVIAEPRAVQAAESLFHEMQALSAKVTPCVERGAGTPARCICLFPGELRRVQARLRTVRSAYPEWEYQIVNWTDPASKQSRALSIQSLVRQSNPTCPRR